MARWSRSSRLPARRASERIRRHGGRTTVPGRAGLRAAGGPAAPSRGPRAPRSPGSGPRPAAPTVDVGPGVHVDRRVHGDPEEPELARRGAGISAERSPTPPVKTSASRPPSEAPSRRWPAQPVHVHVAGEHGSLLAGASGAQHLAHVRGPGQRQHPRAVLERVGDLVHLQSAVLQQPQQQPRVHAARARRHHQALHRREPHRRVDRAPAGDRGERRAGAEVAGDDAQGLLRPVEQLAGAARRVGVREAVEPEAADAMALAPLSGRRTSRPPPGAGVERRVEARRHRQLRQGRGDGRHRVERGRLVDRRERVSSRKRLAHLRIEAHGPREPRPAVDHAMRDRVGGGHPLERGAQPAGIGVPAGRGELGARDQRVVVAQQPQLERARPGVDGQDPHDAGGSGSHDRRAGRLAASEILDSERRQPWW